jgi:tetratricopeptide (TPR) repeat protein
VNPRRLRRIHERIAQAMVRRTPEAVAEIATHFDRGGDAQSAYTYALAAADRARGVYAHQEGTEFLRLAERNAASPEQLAVVRVRLAEIAEIVGRYDEAEELCDLAIEWYAGQGNQKRALSLRRMRQRLRGLLGQPARQMLDACLALDEEARSLGDDGERVPLLTMISQAYQRLGERPSAEKIAWECVKMAEKVGQPTLLADSLNRLAITLESDQPEQATEIYKRALDIYMSAGDARGEARCRNNLGIRYSLGGKWDLARKELSTAITLARATGTPDLWGVAAVNLGVVGLKCGEYDRARDLFGEALALFAGVKNSERQLYALYNLAHLDRERGEHESAAELYDAAAALAQHIGQSDVEIGAIAGAGLSLLHQGRVDAARESLAGAEERIRARKDWFQGRELVEALAVRLAAEEGRMDDAIRCFDNARTLVDASDIYTAAWLTAECAEVLFEHDPERVRGAVERFSQPVRDQGYTELIKRYDALLTRV